MLAGPDHADTTGIGCVVVEPGEAAVQGQFRLDRCGPVAEAPVDSALGRGEPCDRVTRVGEPLVQFGVHRAQQTAPAMRRRDPHPRDPGGGQDSTAGHGEFQLDVVRHRDHIGPVADHH